MNNVFVCIEISWCIILSLLKVVYYEVIMVHPIRKEIKMLELKLYSGERLTEDEEDFVFSCLIELPKVLFSKSPWNLQLPAWIWIFRHGHDLFHQVEDHQSDYIFYTGIKCSTSKIVFEDVEPNISDHYGVLSSFVF